MALSFWPDEQCRRENMERARGFFARETRRGKMSEPTEISFVIPCHNEAANLKPLVAAIRAAIEPLKVSCEIVITDDCSTDNSWATLKELAATDSRIRAQRF